MGEIARRSNGSEQRVEPWGKANPRRGANYEDLALAFVRDFPIGSSFSAAKFDDWAEVQGFLVIPVDVPKDSDAWKAHLQRRWELKRNISRGGCHPRLDTPFTIQSVRAELYEVLSPHVAIGKNDMMQRLQTLFGTKRRDLAYLLQSTAWDRLPPHERAFAESLYDDIDMFQQTFELQVRCFGGKFGKLATKLRRAIESGVISAHDDAVKPIIYGSEEECE